VHVSFLLTRVEDRRLIVLQSCVEVGLVEEVFGLVESVFSSTGEVIEKVTFTITAAGREVVEEGCLSTRRVSRLLGLIRSSSC